MDQNLNNERIVGFLGQSYVLIPRKVLEMLFRGEGRERSVGMVYLALFSEVFFKDGKVFLNKLKEQLPEADSIVDGMKAEFKNFKSRNKK